MRLVEVMSGRVVILLSFMYSAQDTLNMENIVKNVELNGE